MNMRQTFGCNDCNYPRTKKQKLIRHMKRVHMKIKDFKCEQCGYTCSKKQYLDRHIKQNTVLPLRPEFLASARNSGFFFKKPEKDHNFAKRPEFYTICNKSSPKKVRIWQKMAKFYTISQNPIAERDGTF